MSKKDVKLMLSVDFSFQKDYVLENEHALLRPLMQEDVRHLSVFSMHEPALWEYSLQSAAGIGNLTQYVETAIAGRAAGHSYPFIIFCKKSKKYAGTTRFYDIDLLNAGCLLGYTWIGKEFQGTGLNRQCKWLLFQFAFDQCQFHRVALRSDVNNLRSIRAMEAIGCVSEGILREHIVLQDGSWRTSRLFSVLKSEWERGLKQKLNDRC
ncbi:MAG: GNAT family N-acetyltransferase [Bacteroidota bacterium]